MDNKRKLRGDSNGEDKNKIETLPNPVVFSTLQLSTQEFSPIHITSHNTTTQDTTSDLITQDTYIRSSGLIYNNSNSSSSCDLIELARELSRKKKQKVANKEQMNDDKSTETSTPAKLSNQKEKTYRKYQDSSEDDTDIKELREKLKNKTSNNEAQAVTKALENSASYHIFCEIKASLENHKPTDDISSVGGDKSRDNSIDKASSDESED